VRHGSEQLVEPKDHQRSSAKQAQHAKIDQHLGCANQRYHCADRHGVSQGDRREGTDYRRAAALLQTQRDREQPAHRRVDPMVGT